MNYPDNDDFGSDMIPQAIKTHSVYGFDFDDYWQDIGTIRSFYETNLALTTSQSPFNFHDAIAPIYTEPRFIPASIVENTKMKEVLLSEGCRIECAEVTHSLIGIRSEIAAGTIVKDSIIMGADAQERAGIGKDCHIEGAILDKNVRIGNNVVIRPFPRNVDLDNANWYVRDGIVVIPKDVEIPDGTKIEPK
jgi:glucose-1-phosphate adenylyltransferase